MKKFIVVIVILLSAVNIYSQSKTDTTKQKPFEFYTNSFQFRIQQFLTLSDFQGGIISYKYHFNNHYAFRFGLGIRLDNNNKDENKFTFIDSTNYLSNNDITKYEYSFTSQFLFYVNPQSDIKLFIGLGPYVSFSKNSSNNNSTTLYNDASAVNNSNIMKTTYHSLGISAVYGVEWFFLKKMSLVAEYGFSAGYYKSESDAKLESHDSNGKINPNLYSNNTSSGFRFNNNQVNFGLSVYF